MASVEVKCEAWCYRCEPWPALVSFNSWRQKCKRISGEVSWPILCIAKTVKTAMLENSRDPIWTSWSKVATLMSVPLWYLMEFLESEYQGRSAKTKRQLHLWRKHSWCLKCWQEPLYPAYQFFPAACWHLCLMLDISFYIWQKTRPPITFKIYGFGEMQEYMNLS